MTSTGNDIVSLNAINRTRTNQPGFYSKILAPTEKDLYNQPEFTTMPFENFVWLLWSIKESVYKYLQRVDPGLIFTPTKFVIKQLRAPSGYTVTNFDTAQTEETGFDNNTAFKGVVNYGADIIYSRSLIYREMIVSVVNHEENFGSSCWGVKLIDKINPDYQSMIVRQFLVNRLCRLFHFDDIAVSKNTAGVPIVLKENKELPIPVPLSHHDHFVGYSFQLADLQGSVLQ